jgi:hypothetical protein
MAVLISEGNRIKSDLTVVNKCIVAYVGPCLAKEGRICRTAIV